MPIRIDEYVSRQETQSQPEVVQSNKHIQSDFCLKRQINVSIGQDAEIEASRRLAIIRLVVSNSLRSSVDSCFVSDCVFYLNMWWERNLKHTIHRIIQ